MPVKVGLSEIVISPPVGMAMAGYMPRPSHSIGIHDDLHARAIVFSDGQHHAALVIVELVLVPPVVVKKMRELVAAMTPVPPCNVLVAATHTHSGPGPAMFGVSPAPGFEDAFSKYVALLPYHLAGLVYHCFTHAVPVTIGTGTHDNVAIGHHRRTWDPSTDVVDRELVVVTIDEVPGHDARDGVPPVRGLLYNIACHPVKLNPGNAYTSADFPGATAAALGRVHGDRVPVFIQGPAGNVNPWNQPFSNPPSTWAEVERLGQYLAGEVMAATGRIQHATTPERVRAGEVLVTIPVEPGLEGSTDPDDFVRVTVQAIVVDDMLAIVGVPGEMFSAFGRAIKDGVKTKTCIVSELLANDLVDEERVAYIPTREAFVARDAEHPAGGYEVSTSIPNPETGHIIVTAAINLVNGLLAADPGPASTASAG